MSDTPEWKGRRLGSYLLGERFPDIPEDQGRLYAAHHVDEDVRAHFLRAPRPIRSRHRATRWGLTAVALAVGFVFLFWPRTSTPLDMRDRASDTPTFMNGQELSSPVIAYPMPEKPFKEQRKPRGSQEAGPGASIHPALMASRPFRPPTIAELEAMEQAEE